MLQHKLACYIDIVLCELMSTLHPSSSKKQLTNFIDNSLSGMSNRDSPVERTGRFCTLIPKLLRGSSESSTIDD